MPHIIICADFASLPIVVASNLYVLLEEPLVTLDFAEGNHFFYLKRGQWLKHNCDQLERTQSIMEATNIIPMTLT